MAYFFFILVNATLFIRPAEIVQELAGWPIYQFAILCCIATAVPLILNQLTKESLSQNPITVCVIGLLLVIPLSHLSNGIIWRVQPDVELFLKIVIYYLLLVGVIDSRERLRNFLGWLVIFTVVLTSLAVLQYHEYIDIPALAALAQREINPETGVRDILPRLRSTGIFNDPNDLCLILLVGVAASLYFLTDRTAGVTRYMLLGPLLLFIYALTLTHSRGGFVAFLAGLLVLFQSRFGWMKTIPLAGFTLPLMFMLFAGRQTNLDLSGGTGQGRIQLWSAGLSMLRENPLFGVGRGVYQNYTGGWVAHNSFVNTYGDMGFVGGTLFLGAFFFALWTLYRLGQPGVEFADRELQRMRPYLLTLVAFYAAGQMSLSRAYIIPTYMVLGLVTVYLRLSGPHPLPMMQFDSQLAKRLVLVSAAFVLVTYIYVRTFVRWG